jgi:hypothetical protein
VLHSFLVRTTTGIRVRVAAYDDDENSDVGGRGSSRSFLMDLFALSLRVADLHRRFISRAGTPFGNIIHHEDCLPCDPCGISRCLRPRRQARIPVSFCFIMVTVVTARSFLP